MNKMSFPLFSTMISALEESDMSEVTSKQKDEFISWIKTIDSSLAEKIYGLIKNYQIENEVNNIVIPYGAKVTKTQIKFDMDTMPQRLQCLLYIFYKKHNEFLKSL